MTWTSEDLTKMVDKRDYDTALATIERLVAEGVAVDEIRDTRFAGNPPLWIRMLDDGREDAATFALSHGADANARSVIGKPALVIAADHGFRDLVQLMLGRGADVDPSDDEDGPLTVAAKAGRFSLHPGQKSDYLAIVDSLLASGADVNRANGYGHTPLMAAAMGGEVAIMERLESHGARAVATDRQGRAAWNYAAMNDNAAALEHLASIGAGPPRSERFQAIVTFSRQPMSDWDSDELRRNVEDSQYKLGRMKDTAVFKTENIVAGASVDDMQHLYASLRECLADIGGDELMSRCYVHDFVASDGNSGKYVVLLDQSPDSASTPGGIPLSPATDAGQTDSGAAVQVEAAPQNEEGPRHDVAQTENSDGPVGSKRARRWWRRT